MSEIGRVRYGPSLFTKEDIYLFRQGGHFTLYNKLGAHLLTLEDTPGTYFAVWAPNAEQVSVVGGFNEWNPAANPMAERKDGSGIWEGFIPGVGEGSPYKYHISSRHHAYEVDKGDPYAFAWDCPPGTSSRVWDLGYAWRDSRWMETRRAANALEGPWAIYEIHLGSWRRVPEEGNRFLTYRELAPYLADHVKNLGFTHVEFLPIMEHPFYGSWGYETLGYFAPTARYGTPQDLMYLIDYLHQNGIGVIFDWVPSHFPDNEYGLVYFDGTHLYEHADPRRGFQPEWRSFIFNHGRPEVKNFLISSALFWLDRYHGDAIRVDGVASMLYLDYARSAGEWVPNRFGGRENLEAIDFLKRFNEAVYRTFPDVQTVAEESTAWPKVSRPASEGGLGFGFKWNMGWMHDTLEYFSRDPLCRKYHHQQLTFSIWYAFSENFILPLSHDEVVFGKGSLLRKMPGDDWQKFTQVRLLFGYMKAHPGKQLLFMGGEFAQWDEWYHEKSLDWHLLQLPGHQGVQRWIRDLNQLYRAQPAFYVRDYEPTGFEWIDARDADRSVLSFLRRGTGEEDAVLVVCNFTPVPRKNYHVGVPEPGFWREILNSDAKIYGGAGYGNLGGADSAPIAVHGRDHSLSLTLPPLGILFFRREQV